MLTTPYHIPYSPAIDLQSVRYANDLDQQCEEELGRLVGTKVFLTPSCTASLEMAALLCDLQPGDEIVLPSFTHPSTANAFALRDCRLRFIDIDPSTLNADPACLDQAITQRTKAVVITHYAGIACDLDAVQERLATTPISLVEDAAHCIGASYRGQALGSFGRYGAISFHHTKNIHCGEGGATFVNREEDVMRAHIIREKGTNRTAFSRGEIDFYHWVDLGSSYSMSSICALYLQQQLRELSSVNQKRIHLWSIYQQELAKLQEQYEVRLPQVPDDAQHNGHIFYLLCRTKTERKDLQEFLRANGIQTAFHYVPLHSSPAGQKWGEMIGPDRHTSDLSGRLLRLPLFYQLSQEDISRVVTSLYQFYHGL